MADIVICNTCKGKGEVREDIGTHTSEYVTHKCSSCNGTGRQMEIRIQYRIPMITDSNDMSTYYKIDSTIHELLREFVKKLKENHTNRIRNGDDIE